MVYPQPFPIDFCKGLQDGTWYLPRCINCSANGTIVFPPLRCVQRCLARPDRTSRSATGYGFMKSRAVRPSCCTCNTGTTMVSPKGTSPSRLTKFEPNPCIGLACSVGRSIFARVCEIACGTWHVQPSGLQLAPSPFRCYGVSNEHSPVPIRPAVRAQEAKMLVHTYGQTNIDRPPFFQRPNRGNLRTKAFNAKALKPFYYSILNNSSGTSKQ